MSPIEHIFFVLNVAIEKGAISKDDLRATLTELHLAIEATRPYQSVRLRRLSEQLAHKYAHAIHGVKP